MIDNGRYNFVCIGFNTVSQLMAVFCIWGDKPFPELGFPLYYKTFSRFARDYYSKKEGIEKCLTLGMSL